jgi:hypothetical protein
MKRRVQVEKTNKKRSIHFNYKSDFNIASDDQFLKLIIQAMQFNNGVIARYKSAGWYELKATMEQRKKAVDLLKKNQIGNEDDLLKHFKVIDLPNPKQRFTSDLFKNLVPAYLHLIDHHNDILKTQDEALVILLDILQTWYPDIDRIQQIKIGAFRKALDRMK